MSTEPDISVFRPDRPGIRKVLGDLEANTMEIIWARPAGKGTTVRAVFETLHGHRSIAYTTVMTTMTRLAKKHLLYAEKGDPAYLYYPTLTQEEFISRFVAHVLDSLLASVAGLTLNQLGDTLPPGQQTARVRTLREQIARRRTAEEQE